MNYLSPIDAAFVRLESPRTPMNFAALLTFKLPDDAPRGYCLELFAYMRSQAAITPPFCFRLSAAKRALLAPAWETVADIDIDYHLRHSCLPYPGGERELGVLVARLHSNPMDLSRPLWECHLIEGLENHRFAIFLKAHHAALDGMAALSAIKKWLSEDPAFANAPGPWALSPEQAIPPESPPIRSLGTALKLMREHLRAASELSRTLARMSRRRNNPDGGIYSALATPRMLFNLPITQQRRLATQLFELSRLKALSKATGCTINDLSLAICGGAIRRYLLELDALPDAPLIASVPVGLPRSDGKPGNNVAGFVVPLATDQADPLERLRIITTVTRRTKEQMRVMSSTALQQLTLLGLSPMVIGQMTGLAAKIPPLFNVIVSNVVGSRNKLYLRGAELESMYPISVLFDSYALNITIIGYADKVGIGITGCRDAIPRLQRLAVFTGEALLDLERAVGIVSVEKSTRPGKTSGKTARKISKREAAI